MKYRDLNLEFEMEGVRFSAISVCFETLPFLLPMHAHSKNSYEIHYVAFGTGTLITPGGRYEITPGTLFTTGPEIEHEQISLEGDPMSEYCIYLKVDEIPRAAESFLWDFLRTPFWFGRGDERIYGLMQQIIAELSERRPGYEQALCALLEQFVVTLVRHYGTSKKSNKPRSDGQFVPNDLMYLLIEEAFLYNYRDITLKSLSQVVRLSTRQTERLLQLHYNKTFLQKKTEARMSAARSLLQETKMSISEVAEALGYSSVEHFSTAFKKYMGCTPSSMR